jgi:hypothetical protein
LLQQHQVVGQARHFILGVADIHQRDVQFVVQALQVGQDSRLRGLSRAASGSSINSRRGLLSRARAMPTRWLAARQGAGGASRWPMPSSWQAWSS